MNNLIGKIFGRLTVIKQIENDKHGNLKWLCLCNCGNEKIILGNSLVSGRTRSCGCFKKEFAGRQTIKHGHARRGKQSKIYITWTHIINRCTNKNSSDYKDYGGRGIKVCKRWMKFENFYKDVGDPPIGKSLDRINNNKGYFPCNWRWSTNKEQARNRRNNHVLTMNGKTASLAEWEEITGIKQSIINRRLKRGWSVKNALTILINKGNK
jgi:hypothetical protein